MHFHFIPIFLLPSNKIKELETLLDDTEKFFKEALEDGLLTQHGFIQEVEQSLAELKGETSRLRSRAYNATTLRKDYTEFFKGTSSAIGFASQSLKNLRAQVITSSEQGRLRLLETNSIPRSPQPDLQFGHDTDPHLDLSPSIEIPRPSSCPPTLPAWDLNNAQNTLAQARGSCKAELMAPVPSDGVFEDPFADSAQSDGGSDQA
ncbi:hypothetical protein BS17DRAFT_878594 [Gyrodon lividus]|nr:hypothetical protein BS17DRAFT_878594 [Gyrodon lividus]